MRNWNLRTHVPSIAGALTFIALSACGDRGFDGPDDGPELRQNAVESGSAEEAAVLAVVNDSKVTQAILDDDIALDRRAAENIIEHRQGADGRDGTDDDDLFDSIEELDDVPYVGSTAIERILAFAIARGGLDDGPLADDDAAILALVNDPAVDQAILDDDVGLDRRAATNIVEHRRGDDGQDGTGDDDRFDSIEELDAIPYVGGSALDRLLEYALANGYGHAGALAQVIFSPQDYGDSHLVQVAQEIDRATTSLDIAMYSYSDAGIADALERAVDRGISIRFIFETANADRSATDVWNTKSGRLEAAGINVRYVNKIMHHKLVIVDGPRTNLTDASNAMLITGSGNWSRSAGTRYDENTVFLQGEPELLLRYQREFDLLWEHSRDFIADPSLPYELSDIDITDADIDEDAAAHAWFTSDNFNITAGSTTFRVNWQNTVSDQLVSAIQAATDSIWIASGHLRSRPIAEALIAKRAARPDIEIRVYLDGQEYISDWYHQQQVAELDQCLADASTESQTRQCMERGFYFGYHIANSGIDVRYKYYSYRWHYSYAEQMHHKYIIIDGDELWTGSYNFSDNAEHNTFENVLHFEGNRFQALVDAYEANFSAIWETRRDGAYDDLMDDVQTAAEIPLVFDSMALTWNEVTSLKAAISSNCAAINDADYRQNPERHRTCPRP